MSKAVAIQLPEQEDAISRIKKFMSNEESGVVLKDYEEKMLTRLMYCKGLLSERKYTRDQVEEKLKDKFGISLHTARKDLNNTYSVFATITEAYKKFTLQLHVEFLDKMIAQCSADKSLMALVPKFAAEKTRAVNAMPVDAVNQDLPAPVILMQVVGKTDTNFIDVMEARNEADALIEFEKKSEYIDYEDLDKA